MLRVELEASERIATFPLAAPGAVGANPAVKVTLWPAFRVVGNVSPVIENPVPVTFPCQMVTAAPPVLVSVSERLALLPTWTLLKGRLVGLAESVPGVWPVPVTGIFRVGLAPLDVIVTLPLAAPGAVAVNCKLNVVLWPAVRVRGKVSPLSVKPVPVAAAAEIVRLDPPELVSVSVRVFELPT